MAPADRPGTARGARPDRAAGPEHVGSAGPVVRDTTTVPLWLRMRGRLAVVVGGGPAAAGCVTRMLAAGARVLVIASDLDDELAALEARGLITVRAGDYRRADLDDAWLALACADDDSVNARVASDADRLHIWCAGGGDDAAAVLPSPEHAAGVQTARPPRRSRRVLVLGGARSGKSAAAESMLAEAPAVDYVATGQPAGVGDSEWDQRVRDHQARRPAGWRTVETFDVAGILADHQSAEPVLVDCLATWLARVMDDCGLWSGGHDAGSRLAARTEELVAAWQQTSRTVIAVSNEVGSGIVPATASGRRFRDELGRLNSRVAAASEEVWICIAGIPSRLR
jgi:adenosylcobinamide kinase / adenosylcobinamide-phosphate guanylyltransferase